MAASRYTVHFKVHGFDDVRDMHTLTELPERLSSKIEIVGDCWKWTACTMIEGKYGMVYDQTTKKAGCAHRVVWASLNGAIPEEHELDHLHPEGCVGTLCVNPEHLDLKSKTDHALKHSVIAERQRQKTHCPQGHEYTPENTKVIPSRPNARYCRQCDRDGGKARYHAKKLVTV